MKFFVLLVTGFVLLTSDALSQAKVPTVKADRISELSWMVGTWNAKLGVKNYQERWSFTDGGIIEGYGYYLEGENETLAETLLIIPVGDKLVYIASPEGQEPTLFRFTKIEGESFIVENPEHDFPQKIMYTKKSNEQIDARVEGMMSGNVRGFDVIFTRAEE